MTINAKETYEEYRKIIHTWMAWSAQLEPQRQCDTNYAQ
jgi:hypothetical protein